MIKRKNRSDTLAEFNKRAVELFGTNKISYKQAKDHNLLLYWKGTPCEKGHLTFSYVSTRGCRQCAIDSNTFRNKPELVPSQQEKITKKNIEEIKYKLEMKKLDKEYSYDFD